MLMAWLETLPGPARPGKATLPGGHERLQPVRDRRRIHFWFHPCPLFPDLISFSNVCFKKLVPRGRIPGRESSGIRWKIRLENVLGRGLLGGKVAKTAPEIAENARKCARRSTKSPSPFEVGEMWCPGPRGIPKGQKIFLGDPPQK